MHRDSSGMLSRFLKLACCILAMGGVTLGAQAATREAFCANPLPDAAIAGQFQRLAMKQLLLEFGDSHTRIYDIAHSPVGPDLVRVSAYAHYRTPGNEETNTHYITGWISRCQGTLIFRGNTWLADGTLSAPRYTLAQLPGTGLALGTPRAKLHVIAYVDSRCSQCHRLIEYAKPRAARGELYIELRQIAFLEPPDQAVADTRMALTRFASDHPRVSDTDYLQMLSGLPSDAAGDKSSPAFRRALSMINTNTATARNVLHLTTTPGVLLRDDSARSGYRLTGYWEMNRLFQPDL